jgi:ribonuclease J
MVDFQFMSGLNTIGGNILDIRSETGRLLFDYGEISDPKTGQLPDLSHSTENTAIFISHLHIDHIGSFKFIPKEIPIYMSQESYELYQLLVEIGEESSIRATIYPVSYNEIIEIGDITIVVKQSDHDIRGASALFVETPDVKFIYSGDLRLTGNHPEYVETWLKEAEAFDADIFLLEGTAFSFDEDRKEVSEKTLHSNWQRLLKENTEEIIFINTYIRDTLRLLHLVKEAKKQNRFVVLEPKYAYLLEKLEGYTEAFVLEELDVKKKFKERWITIETMQKNPNQYVLQNSFENRQYLKAFHRGIYGHSNGEPLGDYDERYFELIEAVEANHFTWKDFNAGGHATKDDLIKIAKAVAAKVTIPWHSFKPEELRKALAKNGLSTILPERNLVYSLNKLN